MTTAAQTLRPSADLQPGIRESAVHIPAGDGWLAGNVVEPATPAPAAVLFLHGWGGVRGGPHNLLTAMARALAADGVASLRFDFRGRGESSGDGAAITLADMATDCIAAAGWLQSRAPKATIILVGICSGGNIAIGSLDRLERVGGLYLLSVYPFGDGDSFGRDARRTAHFLRQYLGKLTDARTWQRLWRGEIDFGGVGRVLFGHFGRRAQGREETEVKETATAGPLANLLTERPPVRMVYGDRDPDFQASLDYYRAFDEKHGYGIDFRVVPGANHNFYSQQWKDELIAGLRSFVKEQYQ